VIGDQSQRGKGMGEQLVHLLLEYVFTNTNKLVAELYVFDWNIGAIRCYEKAGFVLNPEKKMERTAVNMTIDKSAYTHH
jgi:RimJ/RimL family protein N-acetyltransferase